MKRRDQIVLIGSTLLASWVGMQALHEMGHVIGAWGSGGRVARVVLHPLAISRTDLAENPHPLIVAWAGPVVGVAGPLAMWTVAAAGRFFGAFVLRFFAGFCCAANGLYIGLGSFAGIGDCGEMLRHGSAMWQLWLFGLATAPCGVWLWHRQGEHFGLGRANGRVDRRAAYGTLVVCGVLLVTAFVVGG